MAPSKGHQPTRIPPPRTQHAIEHRMRPHLREQPNAATIATPSDTTRDATSPGETARRESPETTERQDARATRQYRDTRRSRCNPARQQVTEP
eukprot:12482197-Alexandrium_andersonii.AAC.1